MTRHLRIFVFVGIVATGVVSSADAQTRVIVQALDGSAIASQTTLASMAADIATIASNLSPDAVHGNAVIATGPEIQGEAKDLDGSALPNVVTEGQSARLAVTLSGIPFSFLTNEAGTKELGKQEDDAHASADYGLPVWTQRLTAAATSAGASADYATLNTDDLGLLWTRSLDPCSGVAKSYIPISIVTATTTEITPSLAGSSTHYYICSLNLVTAAANNVLVADDDSDGCGSPTIGIFGSDGSPAAGEGWNFAANGGIALGNGVGSVGRTQGTNRVICILTSAGTQLSGMLIVAAAP